MDNGNLNKKLSSSELRKIKKPLIEKRRRERINESLAQLKSLILEALNKDESQYNKMEKADILELTVKHLKSLHKPSTASSPPQVNTNHTFIQAVPVQPAENTGDNYKAGFLHCASEVQRYMQTIGNVKPEVKSKICSHLTGRLCSIPKDSMDVTQQQQLQQQPITATYVQILPKENTQDIQGNVQGLGNHVIPNLPYLQPIQILNGQTVFVASAFPSSQHVLQIAQPLSPLGSAVLSPMHSPTFSVGSPAQESIQLNNLNNKSNKNEVDNFQECSNENNNEKSVNDKNIDANRNIQWIRNNLSTESKAMVESKNQNYNVVVKKNDNLNKNSLNMNINNLMNNIENKRLDRDSNLHPYQPLINRHYANNQCLDNMWRPW